jgi:hypothetical protein
MPTVGRNLLSIAYINTGRTTIPGTAAITLPASLGNVGFMIQGYVLVFVTGQAQGKVVAQAFLTVDNAGASISGAIATTGTRSTPQIAPTSGTASDQNIMLGLAAQFSVANAANSVMLGQLLIDVKS